MADRIASLPMYDFPYLRDATDAWWGGIAQHFREAGIEGVPDELARQGEGPEHWLREDLLFSQTCGYPLMTSLAGKITPVGTPCYGFPECDGPRYCSVVIVPCDSLFNAVSDLADVRMAINMPASWSGHQALRLLQGIGGGNAEQTGSHRASMEAVLAGRADAAAIDCVTYNLLSRWEARFASGLRVICRTPLVPGLPYIAGPAVSAAEAGKMRDALLSAAADPALATVRSALGIAGVAMLDASDYRVLPDLLRGAAPPLLA